MDDPIAKPAPDRPKGSWRKVAAALTLVIVGLAAALPYALGSAPLRRWMLGRANLALSPGKLEVDRFRFSWFGPTVMSGFTIRDAQGDAVVAAPRAVWDRNLFQALFLRPKLGTLSLERAAVDLERRADGSIDLVEALAPILKGAPPTDLTVRVVDGAILARSAGLAGPIVAERFGVTIRRPPAPGDVTWDALLENGGRSLAIAGRFARWDGSPPGRNSLRCQVDASDWPLAIASRGWEGRATLDGRVGASRSGGLWTVDGEASLAAIDLIGEALHGDRPRIDSLAGHWRVEQTGAGWAIRSLDLKSPVAEVHASGPVPAPPGETNRIEGWIDLPSLARMLPNTLRLRDGLTLDRGRADLAIEARGDGRGRSWTAEARLADLAGRVGEQAVVLREPATVSLEARKSDGTIAVEGLAIRSAFLNAEGRGDLDRGVKVAGTVDLSALTRQAADFVDLGRAELSGSGPMNAAIRREGGGFAALLDFAFEEATVGPAGDPIRLQGLHLSMTTGGPSSEGPQGWTTAATIALASARRAGLDLGPTEVAARYEAGRVAFEPVETTLNGGRLRLVPELELGDSPAFRLKSGTTLADAEVNEEASRRVLAFVAPILDGATRARGRVSARIDRAEFPIGPGARDKVEVEGNVVFDDVVFAPGPVTADLLGLINRDDATLRLDQPVVLSISGGKVHQRGLSVPVGDVTRIAIEGSVGFDKTLDLVATMPITPEMFPNGGLIGDVVSGSRVRVPIGGTLDRPKLDKDAFRAGMKDMGKDVMIRGAAGLLFRLARPRDPNAPPPLTPEERKAKRLEKRMQRRGG